MGNIFAPYSEFVWDTRWKCKKIFGYEYTRLMHERAPTIRELFRQKGYPWERYTKIITIRNPWERVVSLYTYLQKYNNYYAMCDFNHFVKFNLLAFMKATNCYTTWDMIRDKFGNIIVDKIIRIEDLSEELPKISDELGIELEIPGERINHTNHAHYTTFYNEETRGIIERLFVFDIGIGGYEFEEEFVFDSLKELFPIGKKFSGREIKQLVDQYI